MSKGLDCDCDCTAAAGCIVAAGYKWVARYIVPEKAQPLTRSEAMALSKAGLFIVSVWEQGFPTSRDYFSYLRGQQDGMLAYQMARQVGQPKGTPIYFCVDYDATEADVASVIADYFAGVRAAFAAQDGNGDPTATYFQGVYGNNLACGWLQGAGLVHFTWLAMPSDWGGAGYTEWNLHQTGSAVVCGVGVDADQSAAKGGGGWKLLS